jgi:hypothetical protein
MTQDMENLRKKERNRNVKKMEGQSIKQEQAEDRNSELEDEMLIKEKNQRTIS